MSKKTTHIMSGNVLYDDMNPKKGFNKAEELKAALSSKTPKIEEDAKSDRKIRAEKKARQSAEIRDRSWETVSGSARPGERIDPRQTSRSGDANGSVTRMPQASDFRPSIFNPDPFSNAKNSEFTDHAINTGKERRKAKREKTQKQHEFEPSRARNTSEVPASMMGFTPHRTALRPCDLPAPEKEHSEITAQRDRVQQSIKAGEKVAEIYRQRDQEKHQEFLNDANDTQKWQDHVGDKIKRSYEKDMNTKNDAFNFGNPNEYRERSYDKDLSKIFKMPPNPEEVKEANIKRKSDHLKDNTRKHRSEDRSWENVENSKGKKF